MKKYVLITGLLIFVGAQAAQMLSPEPPTSADEAIASAIAIGASAADVAISEIGVTSDLSARYHSRKRLLVIWAGLFPLQQWMLVKQVATATPETAGASIAQFQASGTQLSQIGRSVEVAMSQSPEQADVLNGLADQINMRLEQLSLAIDALRP